jgi:hypothetical protein
MTKYVIAEFSETTGLTQTVVKAESKLHALQDYFDVETDTEGHLYLDVESLVADMGHELGYDISIMKVGKKSRDSEPEEVDEYQVDYSPWPFPTKRPE